MKSANPSLLKETFIYFIWSIDQSKQREKISYSSPFKGSRSSFIFTKKLDSVAVFKSEDDFKDILDCKLLSPELYLNRVWYKSSAV